VPGQHVVDVLPRQIRSRFVFAGCWHLPPVALHARWVGGWWVSFWGYVACMVCARMLLSAALFIGHPMYSSLIHQVIQSPGIQSLHVFWFVPPPPSLRACCRTQKQPGGKVVPVGPFMCSQQCRCVALHCLRVTVRRCHVYVDVDGWLCRDRGWCPPAARAMSAPNWDRCCHDGRPTWWSFATSRRPWQGRC